MTDAPTESTSSGTPRTEFFGVSEMALHVFGSTSRSAKARIVRMADRGEIASIRIGRRGDRLFPAAEIDRLHAEAAEAREETNRLEAPKN